MTAAEQNGIDILCDAAGSDMLLSSLFALAAPQEKHQGIQSQDEEEQDSQPLLSSPSKRQAQSHGYRQTDPAQQATPRRQPSSLPSKRKLSDTSAASPSHVCHICRRVYERADHLTRHLRSHENARPYQCSRCPKRFNRADLLTRHETTHDRDGAAKDRPFIRRSDRAAEACLNCAASKAKCEDQKPCSRCRNKSLVCQMPAKRGSQYRTDSQAGVSPSETPNMSSVTSFEHNASFTAGDAAHVLAKQTPPVHAQLIDPAMSYTASSFLQVPEVEVSPDDFMHFTPAHKIFKDIDYRWDLNFDAFPIPDSAISSISTQTFGRSASTSPTPRFDLTAARDRLFAMVLSCKPTPQRIPSFPSLPLLNYLMDLYFVTEERRSESLLHKPSFDPAGAVTELLTAIIASGATHVSASSIWQFGLSLDDIVKAAISRKLDNSLASQDLAFLQACMINLEIGLWSGVNHKMELAESFASQILTLLRRKNILNFWHGPTPQPPSHDDSPDVLDSKWKRFVVVESYKRLIIRLFFYDVQSSIILWKPPLMSYNELNFPPPVSHDLWKARNAEEWRQMYLEKPAVETYRAPLVPEVKSHSDLSSGFDQWFDGGLLDTISCYGLWGQIWAYRDLVRFTTCQGFNTVTKTNLAWMDEMRDAQCLKLSELSQDGNEAPRPEREQPLLVELFFMILYISPEDLQRLSGRNGQEEARKARQTLEVNWFSTPAARNAVWRAGQLLRHARTLPPKSLRGFEAVAVYLASLTLWAWGLISRPDNGLEDSHVPIDNGMSDSLQRFLKHGEGIPAIAVSGTSQMEPLSKYQAVLLGVQDLFQENFAAAHEPVPSFVQCLSQHLGELHSGQS